MRRGVALVRDIEIVAQPKMKSSGLFPDQQRSELDDALADMSTLGHLAIQKVGTKYKQYILATLRPPIKFDLFIATEYNWGLILAIRTGPAEFSKRMVTQRSKGGLLDDDYFVDEGRVWMRKGGDDRSGSVSQPMVDEADFFNLLSCGWVEPGERHLPQTRSQI